jgi:hypothetical protein
MLYDQPAKKIKSTIDLQDLIKASKETDGGQQTSQ